ncbi:RidA family protein [Paenibacillus nasutitermitis]|uniref:Enamine deaminase RidA n=1 Tax=Paenibacillus nasutitermitis TaxID=1652958 RepID=A0A916ZL43_9BACL|nr:RidA family protein [Paenibacillus nasutitermitis]GGE02971.1 enamine deaminase RidA [Paenibacillus nasutitermitis]
MLRKFNPPGVVSSDIYHHGVEVTSFQRLLFISGQVGVGPDGIPGKDIRQQTELAINNLYKVLAGADMDANDIVKSTIYLTDENLLGAFMEAGAGFLPTSRPATTLVIVKALASPDLLVEIEAVAAK